MVGHDIRNPLQAIIGDLFLSKKEIDELPESEAKKYLTESLNRLKTTYFTLTKSSMTCKTMPNP